MRRFFRQVIIIALGTILGVFISLVLLISVFVSIQKHKYTAAAVTKLSPKTILKIDLHGQLIEEPPSDVLPIFNEGKTHAWSLISVKKAIQSAQQDDYIAGIYLELGNLSAGWATLSELREALEAFKQSGKFIVAYAENYTSKSYYLASLAHAIVLHPAGNFNFTGLHCTVLFYKGLLDKLEVVPQIFRVGRYKSAVEAFTRHTMSEASREQTHILLQTIYEHLIQAVSSARDIKPGVLKELANTLAITQPEEAYQARLITQVGYTSDLEQWIKTKLDLPSTSTVTYINYNLYNAYRSKQPRIQRNKEKVAVLIASGTIIDEEVGMKHIVANTFVQTLSEIRKDPSIKAIVLRINSPGGSMQSTDTMWKELMITKSCKPIVASMGDVAASGGYYMAIACQHIFAQPTTITGSIGIFALYFDIHKFLENKLGLRGDVVKTSPSADIFNYIRHSRPLTEQERAVIQNHIVHGYKTFLNKVAIGRQMTPSQIADIAEGRVWPGKLAKQHGLVDELGGLEKAIEKAAELADLKDGYEVEYWPKPKRNWLKWLVNYWYGNEVGYLTKHQSLGPYDTLYNNLQELIYHQGLQAWLPYEIQID